MTRIGRPEVFDKRYFKERAYYAKGKDPKKEEMVARSLLGRVPHGGKALDVGCGAGVLNIHLNRLGFDSTGMDISKEGLEAARANIEKAQVGNIPLIQGDALDLPFADRSFDGVTATDLVEHLDVDGAHVFMSEAYRVLQPGGFLLVLVPTRSPFTVLDYSVKRLLRPAKYSRCVDHTGDETHRIWYSRTRLVELMSEKFKLVHEDYLIFRTYFWPRRNWWRDALDKLDSQNLITRYLAMNVFVIGRKSE